MALSLESREQLQDRLKTLEHSLKEQKKLVKEKDVEIKHLKQMLKTKTDRSNRVKKLAQDIVKLSVTADGSRCSTLQQVSQLKIVYSDRYEDFTPNSSAHSTPHCDIHLGSDILDVYVPERGLPKDTPVRGEEEWKRAGSSPLGRGMVHLEIQKETCDSVGQDKDDEFYSTRREDGKTFNQEGIDAEHMQFYSTAGRIEGQESKGPRHRKHKSEPHVGSPQKPSRSDDGRGKREYSAPAGGLVMDDTGDIDAERRFMSNGTRDSKPEGYKLNKPVLRGQSKSCTTRKNKRRNKKKKQRKPPSIPASVKRELRARSAEPPLLRSPPTSKSSLFTSSHPNLMLRIDYSGGSSAYEEPDRSF